MPSEGIANTTSFFLTFFLSKIFFLETIPTLKTKNISDQEMINTFNCGVGFCLIVNKNKIKKIIKLFPKKYMPYEIGLIEKSKKRLKLTKFLKW